MPERDDWQIPQGMRPDSRALSFDLGRALSAIVWLNATVPDDAFTARVLGTERGGSGVIIDDNMVLTIGYLVTEAEQVWLSAAGGRAVPGSVLAYDQETGFGLITALGKLDLPALPLGSSAAVETGTPLIVAGHGGEARALAARSIAVEPFAGYWEYLIDGAIFTAPAYPNWSGAAAIDADGALVGIGSLHVERNGPNGPLEVNMFVPIDLLKPIYADLTRYGRVNRPPRPWLGVYAVERDGKLVIAGVAPSGPAARAGIEQGDTLLSVDDVAVSSLPDLYRHVWSRGDAGVTVVARIARGRARHAARIATVDRNQLLKRPSLQ